MLTGDFLKSTWTLVLFLLHGADPGLGLRPQDSAVPDQDGLIAVVTVPGGLAAVQVGLRGRGLELLLFPNQHRRVPITKTGEGLAQGLLRQRGALRGVRGHRRGVKGSHRNHRTSPRPDSDMIQPDLDHCPQSPTRFGPGLDPVQICGVQRDHTKPLIAAAVALTVSLGQLLLASLRVFYLHEHLFSNFNNSIFPLLAAPGVLNP